MPETAPFHADLAEGCTRARAWWVRASDGLRLRVARYPSNAPRGSVILFPGRTEYVEKYGRVAADLAQGGYDTLTIDWRGQGLADRMLGDKRIGHVLVFEDYQKDAAALMQAAAALDLPRPWHLVAHSMGGCIGLRAVMEGLDVATVTFTGPMWGIRISQPMRPAAWALSWSSRRVGLGHVLTPGTGAESLIVASDFEDNALTTDPETWNYMRRQLLAQPELQLGGPSMHWLYEALAECRALARRPSPGLPCLCLVGSDERIVDTARIEDRMARWPGGHLEILQDAEHEVLMERPALRTPLMARLADFLDDPAAGSKGAVTA